MVHGSAWPSLIDVSLGDTSTCARVAPPTPEMMRAELASKTFTNASDSDMVLGLYTATANGFLGGAKELDCIGLGWDAAQFRVDPGDVRLDRVGRGAQPAVLRCRHLRPARGRRPRRFSVRRTLGQAEPRGLEAHVD